MCKFCIFFVSLIVSKDFIALDPDIRWASIRVISAWLLKFFQAGKCAILATAGKSTTTTCTLELRSGINPPLPGKGR